MSQIHGGAPSYSKWEKGAGVNREAASMGNGQGLDDILLPGEKPMEEILTGLPIEASSEAHTTIPSEDNIPWINRAAAKEDWEIAEDKKLQLAGFIREFTSNFPPEAFKEPKGIENAAKWLWRKSQKEPSLVADILAGSGLVDEIQTNIVEMIGEIKPEQVKDKYKVDPKEVKDGARQPSEALQVPGVAEAPVKKEAQLERKRVIASYGVILDEESLSLWNKGKLVKSISTDSLGGFGAIASEVDALQGSGDIELLFNLPDTSQNWLVSKSAQQLTETLDALRREGKLETECASIFYDTDGRVVVATTYEKQFFDPSQEDIAAKAFLAITALPESVSTPPFKPQIPESKEDKPKDTPSKKEDKPQTKVPKKVHDLLEKIEDALGIQEDKKHEDKEKDLSLEDYLEEELTEILTAVEKNPVKKEEKPASKEPKLPKEPGLPIELSLPKEMDKVQLPGGKVGTCLFTEAEYAYIEHDNITYQVKLAQLSFDKRSSTFVYVDPNYQRDDQNENPNKNFDENNVDQNREKKSDPDVPPTSVNPTPVNV